MKDIFDVTIIEKCPCGSQIAIQNTMSALAQKHIADWRQNHKCTIKRVGPNPDVRRLEGVNNGKIKSS